jgi:hypothetical protein
LVRRNRVKLRLVWPGSGRFRKIFNFHAVFEGSLSKKNTILEQNHIFGIAVDLPMYPDIGMATGELSWSSGK